MLLGIILISIVQATNISSENSPNQLTNSSVQNNTSQKLNPITLFMQETVSSPTLEYIGAPETLTNKNLIVYILLLLVCLIIILDLVSATGIFNQVWISFGISLIVTLLGSHSGIIYQGMVQLIDLNFGNNFLNSILIPIAVIILGVIALSVFSKISKKIKEDVEKEKQEEFTGKLKTLKKVQEIEMKARGI
jgi:hypothetical protein